MVMSSQLNGLTPTTILTNNSPKKRKNYNNTWWLGRLSHRPNLFPAHLRASEKMKVLQYSYYNNIQCWGVHWHSCLCADGDNQVSRQLVLSSFRNAER